MKRPLLLTGAALALLAFAPPPFPQATIVAPARPRAEPQSLVEPRDYPDPALRAGEEGTVGFALYVGVDGRAGACAVTRSSGSVSLDSATCRIMRSRARFTPATDSRGSAAPSRVEQEVHWTLPAGAPSPVEQRGGHGVMVSHVAPEAVFVGTSRLFPEPIMAIPQSGPGEADLSVWDAPTNRITMLGRYESIPACRKARARLRLLADQKAYCTVAPDHQTGLGLDWER